jgi:hypothetical protein
VRWPLARLRHRDSHHWHRCCLGLPRRHPRTLVVSKARLHVERRPWQHRHCCCHRLHCGQTWGTKLTLHIQRRAFTTGARWCQAAWWTGRASPSLTILDCVEHVEYVVCTLVWTVVAAERRCAMAQEVQGQCPLPSAHCPPMFVLFCFASLTADVPGEISGGGSPPPPPPACALQKLAVRYTMCRS